MPGLMDLAGGAFMALPFLIGGYMVVECLLRMALWPGVDGTVTDTRPEEVPPGADASIAKHVRYSYVVDGTVLEGRFTESGRRDVGEAVRVHYDPAAPDRHFVPTSTKIMLGLAFLALGTPGMLYLWEALMLLLTGSGAG